ncbi:MAG: lytic murein transglycosylase B [Thioalkalivibrionaceae bacterium]
MALRAMTLGLAVGGVAMLVGGAPVLASDFRSEFSAGSPPYLERESVQAFIDERVAAGHERERIEALIAAAEPQQRILELISRPAEARPWHTYRPIFVTETRIDDGRAFLEAQAEWLAKAEEQFGVEREVVTAIVAVETNFGRNQGSFRVLDALVTLGFDYPPRAAFFSSELGHFFDLIAEEQLDPLEIRGSYAGAMGRGQFISSSYRAYAVDFDGSGQRDLIGSWGDAIGSIANYFRAHRWETGRPIVAAATVEGDGYRDVLGGTQGRAFEARYSLEELATAGVTPAEPVDPTGRYSLVRLEEQDGERFVLGYPNFYVITRYNRSPLYAMVVAEIAAALGYLR